MAKKVFKKSDFQFVSLPHSAENYLKISSNMVYFQTITWKFPQIWYIFKLKLICLMSELGFGNKSDFDLKIASLGLLLVWFLVEIWSDKSLILRLLGLIFFLAALLPQSPPWLPMISRPGRSQGLLYKHLRHSFNDWLILKLKYLNGASNHKTNYKDKNLSPNFN